MQTLAIANVFWYASCMYSLTQIAMVFVSALTVMVADAVIKKISHGSVTQTLKDPWMVLVYVLYLIQIIAAIYIFIYKGELAIYANYFIVFYSILGITFGIAFFKEGLNIVQIFGIVLALVAGFLMNWHGK